MGTRGRPKSDEKRQKILAAAIEHFTEHGYGNANLSDVAKAAGVSKQTIYSHFAGKAALLETCIEEKGRESILPADQVNFDEPPEQFLGSFAKRFIETLCEPGPLRLWRLVAHESERNEEIGHAYMTSGPRRVMAAVAEYLRLADRRGELRVPNAELASAQFLFLLKGLPVDTALLNLEEWPHPFSAEEYTSESVQLFLRAYAV